MSVLVTGSLGLDTIMDFSGRFADRIMPDHLDHISLSFLVETMVKRFGGTAGNIAYTLQLFGEKPLIMAPAGNDFSEYLKHLKKNAISQKYISFHKDIGTSAYFVVTDKDHNQIGSFYNGATKYAKKLSVHTVKPRPDLVIIAPTDPVAMTKYVDECQELGLRYMYDPAFQIANFSPDMLKKGISGAHMLIANDYEIKLLEEKLDISHEELRVMVPYVITTVGSKGSIIETRKESIHCKPAAVKAVLDPTGAGDAYRSGFIAGYLHEYDMQVCGQMGSVAAAYSVETSGTQIHSFTRAEFNQRYWENFGTKLP